MTRRSSTTGRGYLCENYHEKTPILLHIKENGEDRELFEAIDREPFEHIWGVQSEGVLRKAARRTDPDHIPAFMPDKSMYPQFIAGVIRLWEERLDDRLIEQGARGGREAGVRDVQYARARHGRHRGFTEKKSPHGARTARCSTTSACALPGARGADRGERA